MQQHLKKLIPKHYCLKIATAVLPFVSTDEPVFSPEKANFIINSGFMYSYPGELDAEAVRDLKSVIQDKQNISSIVRNGVIIFTKKVNDHQTLSLMSYCIYYRSPMVLPKNSTAIEYLGDNYPLYYNDISEINDLISSDNIVAGHTYLINMQSRNDCGVPEFIIKLMDSQMFMTANSTKYVFNL
jgi:hypothetical protein